MHRHKLVNRRFSLKGRASLCLTGNSYKTSSGHFSCPAFFFFICDYIGNILEQKLFDCYRFQVWKCTLSLRDGSGCVLLQEVIWSPKLNGNLRALNRSYTCLPQKCYDLGDALRQLVSTLVHKPKNQSLRVNSLAIQVRTLR